MGKCQSEVVQVYQDRFRIVHPRRGPDAAEHGVHETTQNVALVSALLILRHTNQVGGFKKPVHGARENALHHHHQRTRQLKVLRGNGQAQGPVDDVELLAGGAAEVVQHHVRKFPEYLSGLTVQHKARGSGTTRRPAAKLKDLQASIHESFIEKRGFLLCLGSTLLLLLAEESGRGGRKSRS